MSRCERHEWGCFLYPVLIGNGSTRFWGTRIGFFRTTPLWTSLKTWSCFSPRLGWRVILCSYEVGRPCGYVAKCGPFPIKLSHHTLFFSPSSFFVSSRVVRETRTHVHRLHRFRFTMEFRGWLNIIVYLCHFNIRKTLREYAYILFRKVSFYVLVFFFSFVESVDGKRLE